MEERHQLRIEYDPYMKKVQYLWRGQNDIEWEPMVANSDLCGDEFTDTDLHSVLGELVKVITDTCNTDYNNALGIVFCGTDEDFDDFCDAVDRYYNTGETDKPHPVLIKDTDNIYTSADEVVEKIKRVFAELEDDFSSQDDADICSVIRKYNDAASESIPVCVIGTYSAGKSTFINALIGQEILPSDQSPTTAKVFKVTPVVDGCPAKVCFGYGDKELCFTYKDGKATPPSHIPKELAEMYSRITALQDVTEAELIAYTIREINDLKTPTGIVHIIVPFINTALPTNDIQFEIYDTPGPDAASHQEDHRAILQAALQGRTNGLPILITDKENLDKTGTADLKRIVDETAGALDLSNVIVIINKADRGAVENLKLPKGESAITKWKNNYFFVSAALALGCKREDDRWLDKDCEETFEDNQKKFSDPDHRRYKSLPQYNKMPVRRKESIVNHAKMAEQRVLAGDGSNTALMELIAHNSGIRGVESEIAYFARRYSNYNKCRMASEYLAEAIGKTVQKIAAENTELKRKKGEQDAAYNEKFDNIDDAIKQYANTFIQDAEQNAPRFLQKRSSDSELSKKASESVIALCAVHKKDKKKSELNESLKKELKKLMENFVGAISDASKIFWSQKEVEFKQAIIKIINENTAITDTQREFLAKTVMSHPGVITPQVRFDLKQLNLIERKWFLFIPTDAEKVDVKKCIPAFDNEYKKLRIACRENTTKVYTAEFQRWSKKLLECLKEKFNEFNEDLRRMAIVIKVTNDKINRLEEQTKRLEDAKTRINNMMAKQSREE